MHDYLIARFTDRWVFWTVEGRFVQYRSDASLLTKREASKIKTNQQPYYSEPLEIRHHKNFN